MIECQPCNRSNLSTIDPVAHTVGASTMTKATPVNLTHTVTSAVRVLLGLLLLGMVAINVANAICRYVFGVVLTGADEVLVFTMIWMVMVGMILATIDRRHIALDFLVTRAGHASASRSRSCTTPCWPAPARMRQFTAGLS